MDRALEQVLVPVDQFAVAARDCLLCAVLEGSFAICIGDEMEQGGALLHMQAGRPGRNNDPELTDNTLSTDLLLFDRCLSDLKVAEPRARHWQARFVAHADPRAGGRERLDAIQCFIAAYLEDTGIRLVSQVMHDGPPRRLSFRAAIGQLRCEPAAPGAPR
jgi:chemotaxis receptor (MCP) glutamine deamidase CheD